LEEARERGVALDFAGEVLGGGVVAVRREERVADGLEMAREIEIEAATPNESRAVLDVGEPSEAEERDRIPERRIRRVDEGDLRERFVVAAERGEDLRAQRGDAGVRRGEMGEGDLA